MKKLRKLFFKLFLVLFLVWVLYVVFEFSDHWKENVTKKNTLKGTTKYNPIIEHLKPNPFLSPRDKQLQKEFKSGQDLRKYALQNTPFVIDNVPLVSPHVNESDFINKAIPKDVDYSLLDSQTKQLIYAGLIVPRWNLQYDEIPFDKNAPGEMGAAVNVNLGDLTGSEKVQYDQLMLNNAFNGFASNKMSLHRTLHDTRHKLCKGEDYSSIRIKASVIIIFHNENWVVLLRTVHSVFDRTPPSMLHEVILVDDFSEGKDLKEPLDAYMAKMGKVKVVRASKRQGLIRARILGADIATGDVLTFLDSHCECTKGWMQPMLKRIQTDSSFVVTPVIDVIHENTFNYLFSSAEGTNLGGFDWKLTFTWHAIPPNVAMKRKNIIEPLSSPTMAGGLFSIDRKFFEKIGSYDPGMEVWGGENLELSFRVWMCGGRLEIMQCSHVGHVFRKRSPYKWHVGNALRRNSVRTALVWMDEYKELYFNYTHKIYGDYGDISERLALRQRLQCKSFKWYLQNVYPEQFIPSESLAIGAIRSKLKSMRTGSIVCLEAIDKKIKPLSCDASLRNQNWHLTKNNEIYLITNSDEECMDYAGVAVQTYSCHGMRGNQEWNYREDNMIMHTLTRKCLQISADFTVVTLNTCLGTDNQLWKWDRRKIHS